jgi:hypothetical protein
LKDLEVRRGLIRGLAYEAPRDDWSPFIVDDPAMRPRPRTRRIAEEALLPCVE